MKMDKKSIVIEYARSYNNLDIKYIYPYLAEDVKYNTQDRICELNGVNQVSKHLKEIFSKNKHSHHNIFAEIGETQPYPMYHFNPEPCILLSIYKEEIPRMLVLLDVKNSKIKSICVCLVVPHPSTAIRLGYYPI